MLLDTLNNNVVCGTLRVVDQTIHYETIAEIERRINWSLLSFDQNVTLSILDKKYRRQISLVCTNRIFKQETTVHAINSL